MSERSPEEREAARLERARRRARARGEEPPAALEPFELPAAPEPVTAPEPEPVAGPEPVAAPEPLGEPEGHEGPSAQAPRQAPVAREPAATALVPTVETADETAASDPTVPDAGASEPVTPAEPAPPTAAPLPAVADRHRAAVPKPPPVQPVTGPSPAGETAEHDAPIGTVRPGAGAPGMPRQPVKVPRRRRRRPARLTLVLVLLVTLVAAVAYVADRTFTPFSGQGSGTVVVRIPQGASTRQIGNLLAAKGVVGSGFFFALRAKLGGGTLRSGTFTLRRGMSNGAALSALTTATQAAPTIRVLIPEGPGRREVAPIVARQGVTGNYLRASVRSPLLRPRSYGAPRGATLEGFLFPATYDLLRGASARTLVRKQLEAFKASTAGIDWSYARSKNLTRYDVLTIASIIEREAFRDKDRPLVAAVFYNRLRDKMALGSDATTRYAVANFTRPLKVSQLRSTSPYNTRLHVGLPPGPIGNPGLASIQAAAHPAKVPYLYFIVKACGHGALAFSATNAQFQKNVAAYNAARARNGGSDPSVCKK